MTVLARKSFWYTSRFGHAESKSAENQSQFLMGSPYWTIQNGHHGRQVFSLFFFSTGWKIIVKNLTFLGFLTSEIPNQVSVLLFLRQMWPYCKSKITDSQKFNIHEFYIWCKISIVKSLHRGYTKQIFRIWMIFKIQQYYH